jgi:hypothetical protein
MVAIRFHRLLIVGIFLATFFLGCDFYKSHAQGELSSLLFDGAGKPTLALVDVLQQCNIEHDGSLADIVAKTQKGWLRPAGVERYQMDDPYVDKLDALRPAFKKLGLVDDVLPSKKEYDYVLVHGATLLATRARIAFLVKSWLSGVRFKQIVFLTGARMLDSVQESVDQLCDVTQTILPIRSDWQYDASKPYITETDMTGHVYEQGMLPAELKEIPFRVVDAPQQVAKDGSKKRPNTIDTLNEWLKTNPQQGSCLFISNQPFVGYQDSIAKTVLPSAFSIETVGFAIPASYEKVSLYLDSLARWLYQEQIRVNQK